MIPLRRAVLLRKATISAYVQRLANNNVQQQSLEKRSKQKSLEKLSEDATEDKSANLLGESVIYDELEEQSKQTDVTNRALLSRRFSARGTKKKVVANRFRPVIYSEGELEKSDLSQPPSRSFSVAFRSRGFHREKFLPSMKLFTFLICIHK
ncbi:unnamed protein product [Gongylonema pulchrum]|uniref:Uncharacterized protein n=1 Tax=Gongylonema pulchrum TaxID=637853 RepID=A0A183ET56_9BILA|nr:unnamed protein product [Gongylonema pulchrum]